MAKKTTKTKDDAPKMSQPDGMPEGFEHVKTERQGHKMLHTIKRPDGQTFVATVEKKRKKKNLSFKGRV